MTRTTSPVEFNALSKGLNTDSSPLNYQPDSAQVLKNFKLNLDGTVQRRKGLVKVLPDSSKVTNVSYASEQHYSYPLGGQGEQFYLDNIRPYMKGFVWENAGPEASDTLIVLGNPNLSGAFIFFKVVDGGLETIPDYDDASDDPLHYLSAFTTNSLYNRLDVTFANNKMYAVNSSPYVKVFTYDGTAVRSLNANSLRVRDFWGIPDYDADGSTSLISESGVRRRPQYTGLSTDPAVASLFSGHVYNLINQGWDKFTPEFTANTSYNPLSQFNLKYNDVFGKSGVFPSNADKMSEFVYANTAISSGSKTVERFDAEACVKNQPSNQPTSKGSAIIDLIQRQATRENFLDKYLAEGVERGVTWGNWSNIYTFPRYNTSANTGPSCIESYAGRLWYSGIGENNPVGNEPDETSPNLSKMVLFSQLLDSPQDEIKCYQFNDPNDKDNPDILDTDGGYIVINEANVINKLVAIDRGILVFATNGIWMVRGSADTGFTATQYEVIKISDLGCPYPDSIVRVDSSVMYLGDKGLYQVSTNEVGTYVVTDIATGRISNKIRGLSSYEAGTFYGCYDKIKNEVIWNYQGATQARELRLNLDLGSYYEYAWDGSLRGGEVYPIINLPIPKTLKVPTVKSVVSEGNSVVNSGSDVTYSSSNSTDAYDSTLRIIQQLNNGSPRRLAVGFAVSASDSFYDWTQFPVSNTDSLAVWDIPASLDTKAEMVTGYLTGGDTQRYKQVPYLTMLMRKTETGFEEVGGDLVPVGESSVLVQSQWEWADSVKSGRWGRPFQAYRHKRFYMPEDGADAYEDGHSVVTTKNKLRGKGRALSLYITTEPGKDCHLLGMSMNMSVSNAV